MIGILWRVALLPLALLIETAFSLLGFILVPIAAGLGAYRYRASERFPDRLVMSWTWRWMHVFGNEEDGINGVPIDPRSRRSFRNSEWVAHTWKWSVFRTIVVWAAFRNGVSNLRYTRWGLLVDPRKIRIRYNNGTQWFVSHGWRSTYWYQGRRWRFWIGWNLKPWDYSPFATALNTGDPRAAGVGFKLQFKRAR